MDGAAARKPGAHQPRTSLVSLAQRRHAERRPRRGQAAQRSSVAALIAIGVAVGDASAEPASNAARSPTSLAEARPARANSALVRGGVALAVGKGLRFNNPYRLAAPLGDTAESLSASATYLEVAAGVVAPVSDALWHGAALSGVVALQGIGQFGLTPAYLAELGCSPTVLLRGRVGVPIIVAPDTTWGLEAALGPKLVLAHGLGVSAELVANAFFGASTEETSVTTIPMLSLQLGLFFDHEVRL